MSNSNENDIKEKTLFENINDFDDFRNQFQQAIDVAAQNLGANIDIDNFLKTSGSTFESNGWQFKTNNVQSAQSNTNTNNAQNLLSENRDNVNQNILNEIKFGLYKQEQQQNKAALTKLLFDNLEAFELKIDSAEILWLLKELKPGRQGREMIDRYKNKLSEIFGRYIRKLIHRSEILQLEEQEQKLFTYSMQALASCAVKIIFSERYPVCYPANFEAFKTNFQQLEKMVTQKMLSINSASAKKSIDKVKSESEVVNDVFVILIDEIIALNRMSDRLNNDLKKHFLNGLLCCLMGSIKTNLSGLSLEIKREIIKFLSRENSNADSRKKFDYLDYESWDWETFADLDFMFKLTIDKFDYNSLKIPDDLNLVKRLAFREGVPEPLNYIITIVCLDIWRKSAGGTLRELLLKLKFPDYVSVIKSCHLSLIKLCFKDYNLENFDELLDDIKNVLRAVLKHYKSNSKINHIIADLWEANFEAQINYLGKVYNFNEMRSRELKEGSDEKMAKEIEEIFDAVKKVFSSEVQPKTVFEAFKILFEKNENDKLKELIGDDNIFNLFLEYVEQDVKNNRSNEHANPAQFNSLITKIKNKNNSDELSIDDKSSIAEFFLSEDFDYVDNMTQITNKLKKLILTNDISDDNISSKENKANSAKKDIDNTKSDLKINEQTENVVQNKDAIGNSFTINNGTENELTSNLHNTKKEKEKTNVTTQQNQKFKLELTLSNDKTISLSSGSCQTAMAKLRECSDFCYQICSIKEAIEQKKCSEAADCWKQLYAELTWWESMKVSLYSWFLFGIAKRWRGNMNIGIKLTMPIQSDTNFSKGNRENDKFPGFEGKEKTFHNIDQSLDK